MPRVQVMQHGRFYFPGKSSLGAAVQVDFAAKDGKLRTKVGNARGQESSQKSCVRCGAVPADGANVTPADVTVKLNLIYGWYATSADFRLSGASIRIVLLQAAQLKVRIGQIRHRNGG